MARKPAQPSKCKTGKHRYSSELNAKIALAGIKRDDAEQRVYRCKFCNGWHLTSQDKKA